MKLKTKRIFFAAVYHKYFNRVVTGLSPKCRLAMHEALILRYHDRFLTRESTGSHENLQENPNRIGKHERNSNIPALMSREIFNLEPNSVLSLAACRTNF